MSPKRLCAAGAGGALGTLGGLGALGALAGGDACLLVDASSARGLFGGKAARRLGGEGGSNGAVGKISFHHLSNSSVSKSMVASLSSSNFVPL